MVHPVTARLEARDRKVARRADRLQRLIDLVRARDDETPERIGKRLMMNPANVRLELATAGYEWRNGRWCATQTSMA